MGILDDFDLILDEMINQRLSKYLTEFDQALPKEAIPNVNIFCKGLLWCPKIRENRKFQKNQKFKKKKTEIPKKINLKKNP